MQPSQLGPCPSQSVSFRLQAVFALGGFSAEEVSSTTCLNISCATLQPWQACMAYSGKSVNSKSPARGRFAQEVSLEGKYRYLLRSQPCSHTMACWHGCVPGSPCSLTSIWDFFELAWQLLVLRSSGIKGIFVQHTPDTSLI